MKINLILKEILEENSLTKSDEEIIEKSLKEFIQYIAKKTEKFKKKPEIFIGGSYAKKTMVKKNRCDLDIFLRFDKDQKNISEITENILKDIKNVLKVHGSRDYFRIKINDSLYIELVPVIKIKKPEESKNITDLSYSHVKYINGKIKTKKILDDIKIAKTFCNANKCYGAESYINGFSGYALELLVYHYKSFLKMIKELSKDNKDKIIIDIEKKYKIKKNILLDMNSSKIQSPIILIDPTYPQRNALAALSEGTFKRFKEACKEFIKRPSKSSFELKKIDLNKIKKDSIKNKNEFILIEISTNKQEGDIAGSKLLKFYNHLCLEIERFFNIKNKGFNYNEKKSARCFFVVSKKKELNFNGPSVKDIKNVDKFKKEHKKTIEKKGRLYAIEKINMNLKEFIKKWKIKNSRKIKEMSINDITIIDNI
jgi:tRNA nucleotidyltransferase (CCA-adding enzyme)